MISENTVRNIAKEVLKELEKLNVKIEDGLCRYYVKLLQLDPNWQISDNIMSIRSVIQNFVGYIVSRFKTPKVEDLKMVTIRLQYYFRTHFENIEVYASYLRASTMMKLDPLQFSIIEPLVDKDDLEKMFKKVVVYITFVSGLGDPRIFEVYKEVSVVLNSVMDENELSEFPKDLYIVRREKLDTLVRLVSGIRLYNKHCSLGGRGILNLPLLLNNAITAIKDHFYQILELITERRNLLSRVVDNCYVIRHIDKKIVVDWKVPLGVEEGHLEYAKDLLIVYTEFILELSELIDKVDQLKARTVRIQNVYDSTLAYLHSKIIRNLRIRASLVFPSFEKLFDTWKHFQNETFILWTLKHIFDQQYKFVRSLVPYSSKLVSTYMKSAYGGKNLRVYKSKFHIMTAALIGETGTECFEEEQLGKTDDIKFEFAGYCCWTLVLTDGIFKKGQVDHGVAKYQNRYYVFATKDGFRSFIEHPTYFIFHILEMARKRCELVKLLDLREQLMQYANINTLTLKVREGRMSKGVQMNINTPMVVSNIDPNYEWNVWNLKNKAFTMGNLMRRKTTSSQTDKFGSKESWGCQKNTYKKRGTQTNNTVCTNTPHLNSVAWLLRDTKGEVFDVDFQAD